MKRYAEHLRLAATDITTFSACGHATVLDVAAATGEHARPTPYPDIAAELLRQRGLAHEAAFLATLRETRAVEAIPEHSIDAAQRTADAMQRGIDVIHQGVLQTGRWVGRPDFLMRVPHPQGRWAWSYEPLDAKLALTAKVRGLLQLSFYADLLGVLQGVQPARMTLVLGDTRKETFATARYAAYFRRVRHALEEAIASSLPTYPEPVEHCDVCDWFGECDARRRADDHLSLVAGISSSQRRALDRVSVRKVARLAVLEPDIRVEGIGRSALQRVREQARVQVEGRQAGKMLYELVRDVEDGHGLSRLPEPSPGDLFVDLEGDSYALGEGLEYLFGVAERALDTDGRQGYTALWAVDRASERAAFERLFEIIRERRARYPDMHVYHYAPYEPTAFKRLAGCHATCVDALDELLRARVFVDLFAVVRQGVRASVESYSIKRLEPLYGFERDVPLPVANRNLTAFAGWLEQRGTSDLPADLRAAIEGYNRDDCRSALRLHAWLEERRGELEGQRGFPLPRPRPVSGEASEDLAEHIARVRDVMGGLLAGVPDNVELRNEAQDARYVLAHLLEWHRREDKSTHWEYYRLCELPDAELVEDRTAIGGLTYEGVVGKVARSLVHRYRFPPQDQAIDRARELHDPKTRKLAGTLVRVDESEGILELKRVSTSEVPHPTALIPYEIVDARHQRDSLLRLGKVVREDGARPTPPFAAALALLHGAPPRAGATGSNDEEAAIGRALAVKDTVLAVQGPPGTGKTYLGARMIVALLNAGKTVGITANSHRVITRLLGEVCEAARREHVSLSAIQKKGSDDEGCSTDPLVTTTGDNGAVADALAHGTANVAAGTSWMWAREGMIGAVDVLFVDEAGQMSLANVLASAPASRGIVLLGDPQQLDQPTKGVHPPGVAVSALGHVLRGATTMSPERGLFLEETWRMHPDVCAYISEAFYEGRLRSRPDLSRIRLDGPHPLSGTGLRFVPVDHRGNRSESVEEARAVASLVDRLVLGGSTWTDRHGEVHRLRREDVLVVAPYNAHVALLRKHVPGALVGTVDKFQGQQAPIVIYAMATSSPEDAPRGPEFLYSGNRLNVAISRARCSSFLVANPSLFERRCKTGREMELVNAFCRYLELARECRC